MQKIAACLLGNVQALLEHPCLRTLARSGATQKNQPHMRLPPSGGFDPAARHEAFIIARQQMGFHLGDRI